jgi:ketosteroid isomerase-like protein
MRIPCTAAALLLCVSGLATAAGPPAAAGRAELLRAGAQFARASVAHGLAGWLSWFADDAAIYPPNGPVVRGLAAIRAHYARTGFTPAGLVWTPDHAEISDGGDLGVTSGRWTWRGRDASGKGVERTGKYLTVWRRQRDRSWKLIADIGNAEEP